MLSNEQLAALYDSNDGFVPPVAPVATPAPARPATDIWTLYLDDDGRVPMEEQHVLDGVSWGEEDEEEFYKDEEEYLDEEDDDEDDPCAGCTLCDPDPEEETTEELLAVTKASLTDALRSLLGDNRVVVMISIIK